MNGNTATPLPKDHPLMVAWEAFKATEEFENAQRWAAYRQHVDGALWAAFSAGYKATCAPARQLEAGKDYEVREAQSIAPSEALYGFAGWITSREDMLCVGSACDAAPMAGLVNSFLIANRLSSPAEGFEKKLQYPSS